MTILDSLKPSNIAIPLPKAIPQAEGKKTPKTPQDEAISFFSGEGDGEPVQVWELSLEDDGGPSPEKSVSPYIGHVNDLADIHIVPSTSPSLQAICLEVYSSAWYGGYS